ncbi:MAG: adenosylcobinamide-GDP ribazoletransferase [Magnetococcales bacterium]|nr:adenosylcobinamide-GDP ribazoletransferase [Magnetococcales bacterium]
MITPLRLAFGLLTKIPISQVSAPTPKAYGHSILYYPLVGLVIGAVLAAVALVLEDVDPGLRGALILVVWVWLTGGLHLDGLADVADAWIGGMASRERLLAILKDPRSGPGAVVAVVLLLLVKFAALQAILASDNGVWWLLSVPMFGRLAIVYLLLRLDYLREGGMGAEMAANIPRIPAWIVLAFFAIVPSVLMAGGEIPLLAVILFLSIFGYKIQKHPGGITGDFLGAGCELSEVVYLVALVLMPMFV